MNTTSGKRAPRVAAAVAAIVAAASLAAAGAHSVQAGGSSALPVPGDCDDWGCGSNHNDVMAGAIWGNR